MMKILFRKILKLFLSGEKYAKYLGVKVGKNCSFYNCSFGSEPYLIEIGDYVQITEGVKFINHSGGWIFRKKYPKFDCFGKIIIKNNVYIGNNVIILPGVIIGNNVIIGAGSIVTKSIPDNSVVAGNPVRFVCSINDLENRLLPFNLETKGLPFEIKKKLIINKGNFITKASLEIS